MTSPSIAHRGNANACRSAASLPRDDIAVFVLEAPLRSVRVLAEISSASLREVLESVEPQRDSRRALLVPLRAAATSEALVQQIIDFLAATAKRLWPVWYSDVDFSSCTPDRLGRLAAGTMAATAARSIAGASPMWAERAAPRALDARPIRDKTLQPSVEIAQLALAINRSGLTLVVEAGSSVANGVSADALVHALEWTANWSGGAVLALFDELPTSEPPLDRILYGARCVATDEAHSLRIEGVRSDISATGDTWLAPWRGRPHPMSDIEMRLATILCADLELGPLFAFNQTVPTVRGSSPKVDLLWGEGRLVVEIDGYESHGNRRAFSGDRHRDYELILSGYTVLRLPNDEIAQDLEKAVDKIRDLVHMRRALMNKEN